MIKINLRLKLIHKISTRVGCISSDIFGKWLKNFQAHRKSNKEDPIILICDEHTTHKSINALVYQKNKMAFIFHVCLHIAHAECSG